MGLYLIIRFLIKGYTSAGHVLLLYKNFEPSNNFYGYYYLSITAFLGFSILGITKMGVNSVTRNCSLVYLMENLTQNKAKKNLRSDTTFLRHHFI